MTENERHGHIRLLLRMLQNRFPVVKVPDPIDPSMVHLIESMGFRREREYFENVDEWIDIYVWRCETSGTHNTSEHDP